jgi:RNA polymerase sigma-70 factor (ECF subfamily)
MIQQLPTGYRIVFNLYAVDGYSHKEIGAQLGISENTSKSQQNHPKNYLQRMLVDQEGRVNKNQQP